MAIFLFIFPGYLKLKSRQLITIDVILYSDIVFDKR